MAKKKAKRRKDAPFVPYKNKNAPADSPKLMSAKQANTLARRGRIQTIVARTARSRAQLDAFTAGVDMSDLDDYPVITKLGKPKPMPLPKPTKPARNNDARMSLDKPRKPTPVRTRQNRCTYCQELGHNRAGCTKRKEFQSALATTKIRSGEQPTNVTITFKPAFTTPPRTTIAAPLDAAPVDP